MAAELGWDDERLEDEVDHYLRRVEAERQSQEKATDQEADEARVRHPKGPGPSNRLEYDLPDGRVSP